jgi:hypothetical protein
MPKKAQYLGTTIFFDKYRSCLLVSLQAQPPAARGRMAAPRPTPGGRAPCGGPAPSTGPRSTAGSSAPTCATRSRPAPPSSTGRAGPAAAGGNNFYLTGPFKGGRVCAPPTGRLAPPTPPSAQAPCSAPSLPASSHSLYPRTPAPSG